MDLSSVIHPAAAKDPVPSDIDISQACLPVPITKMAKACGLLEEEYEVFGRFKAKVHLSVLDRLKDVKDGHYVLVTGMTPTSAGEGKSTATMGVSQCLGVVFHKNAFATVRQPSMGPIFGIKGGSAGGGYAKAVPIEDFNLGLPDINSVTAANNLLAAAIDTRMFHENTQSDKALFDRLFPVQKDGKRKMCLPMERRFKKLGIAKARPEELSPEEISRVVRLDIDPATITWQRVLDVNDRFLRKLTGGQGSQETTKTATMSRVTGFDISVASEVMAALALCRDIGDLRDRMGRIVIGFSKGGLPVSAEDIGCAGAMTALLNEAIMPNLMQSLEGTPLFVHCGPFANIAHGNSSIIADRIALKLVGPDGYVLTEAGFGADIGMEKFFNIKCRYSGLKPSCIVLVATTRALKNHAGIEAEDMKKENLDAIRIGMANVCQHIENSKKFGVPMIICANTFAGDHESELKLICEIAKSAGAYDAGVASHWMHGGAGAKDVATAVIRACTTEKCDMRFLYPLDMPIKEKIITVCREIYRADGVDFPEEVEKRIASFEKAGFGNLPVCLAKTQYSFSANPELLGAPRGFRIRVRDCRASVGAGFVFPILGDMPTIPGLPTRPAFYDIDVDSKGVISGLF